MLCVILALEMILNILYISFFYHIYVSMYLFYVVDGLDIKKIEKKWKKKNIFVPNVFFPAFFPLLSIFSAFFPAPIKSRSRF